MINLEQIILPEEVKKNTEAYILSELRNENPYSCNADVAQSLAQYIFHNLTLLNTASTNKLISLIEYANTSTPNIAPVFIKGVASEPQGSFVEPSAQRYFDYASNPADRMKKAFVMEWVSWAYAMLFNYDNLIHPSEHGGNNRFHMVSPRSGESDDLRHTGASTGGGYFHQHSDATVYTEIINEEQLNSRLNSLNTSLEQVAAKLCISTKDVVSQVLCGQYVRVDATMLAGIVNKNTTTHLSSPPMLEEHLFRCGFSFREINRLSTMPIAHLAGPADGEISGYVGHIGSPIQLDSHGRLVTTCLNLASNRMIYVGNSNEDEQLFARFFECARQVPVIEILIESGDILLFPNSYYGSQRNVTHGRGQLTSDEYRIEIEPGKFLRRSHCRQYLTSRNREKKPSFLSII